MRRLIAAIAASFLAFALLTFGITKEVPVGGLHGQVKLEENGRPMPNALVVVTADHSSGEYDWVDQNWHARTDANGNFSIHSIPAGDYRIEVTASEHSLEDQFVTVSEGQPTEVSLALQPGDFRLNMYLSQKVLPPNKPTIGDMSGFVNDSTVRLEIRKLHLSAVAKGGGIREALESISYDRKKLDAKDLDALSDTVSNQTIPIRNRDIEGAFEQKLDFPALSEGLYLAIGRSGDQADVLLLNVTKIALITKTDNRGAHCFVADIDTGQPIRGAQILSADLNADHYRQVAVTDRDGRADVSASPSGRFSVLARLNDSFAVVGLNAGERGEGDSGEPTDPNTRIFTYTDRPVYRPGDTIQFKAIVRHLQGAELKLPSATQAKIKIYDPGENLLQEQTLPISSHGTLHGSFSTLTEAPPGVYRIEVHAQGGVDHYYANLAAYRKPDYSIKVTPAKARYNVGDTASATVECQYFFGGPVVGAKITAQIFRSPVWQDFEDEEDSGMDASDDTGDEDNGGEFVKEVPAVTDGLGHATIQFPTTPETDDTGFSQSYDYRYTVRVSIQEAEGPSFEGSGSVLVTRGNLRLTASTDPFIAAPGQSATLTVQTADEDNPQTAVPNRPIHIQISQRTWTRHTEVDEPVQTLDLTTGPDGKLNVPLIVGHTNDLFFTVSTTDDGGRKITAETDLYVEGGGAAESSSEPALKVRVDRPKYNVGDQVTAMIQTKSPGGVAFLTVQADDIKMVSVVPLQSGSTIVKFPLTRKMVPNAFVHVAYIHARAYDESERQIKVERPDRQLRVTVTPNKDKALPGSLVTFNVRTQDKSGAGVPSEISLGVVDESIYAIQRDTTNIVAGLYPARLDEVRTEYSFPEIYLDGGNKAGGSVPVRRKFLDTASWTPTVETDSSGRAQVTVKLPDNLTSWRATAVAVTDASSVGMATANVRASKPIMVRVEAPQFMVAGDRQAISVAVTNDSGSDTGVNLALAAQDVSLTNAPNQNIRVANGQTVSVDLDATAQSSGTASITATARSNAGADAVQNSWPVVPHGRLVVQKGSSVVSSNTAVNLDVLSNRDLNTGSLVVTLSPSTVSGMLQSLDSLIAYPYGCVEQTMSRFLPAVLVANTVKDTPFENPALQTKVKGISADGFARLQKMQHEDGGWGWWTYDQSDPFMTAWVLDGLKRAKDAGYPASDGIKIDNALTWAKNRLTSPFKGDETRDRLFLAYALAEYGQTHDARAALQSANLAAADTSDLALAVLAAHESGEQEIQDQALARLQHDLDEGETYDKPWYFWDEGEYQSLALLALEKADPSDPRIETLVQDLNRIRGCDGWDSTRESSLAITGLCNYIQAHPEAMSGSQVEISLNDRPLKTITFDPATHEIPQTRIEIPVAQLKSGTDQLTLKATKGRPAFAYELRQYDVAQTLPAILNGSDLQITRAYYRLEPHQMPDGTQKLLPTDQPITSAHAGDTIRCEITVKSSKPVDYLMVEDPIPANMRVTDREDPGEDETWSYWWSSLVIRDDRVSLFAQDMQSGTHKLTYVMRAEGNGTACALPTRAELMYRPNVFASGASTEFQVTP